MSTQQQNLPSNISCCIFMCSSDGDIDEERKTFNFLLCINYNRHIQVSLLSSCKLTTAVPEDHLADYYILSHSFYQTIQMNSKEGDILTTQDAENKDTKMFGKKQTKITTTLFSLKSDSWQSLMAQLLRLQYCGRLPRSCQGILGGYLMSQVKRAHPQVSSLVSQCKPMGFLAH